MKQFNISIEFLIKIQEILRQLGFAVKHNYSVKIYTDITPDIVNELYIVIESSINNKSELTLNIYQYFTLLRVLDFFILDMGVDEFDTVTGMNFYEDGILLLHDLRRQFIGLPIK